MVNYLSNKGAKTPKYPVFTRVYRRESIIAEVQIYTVIAGIKIRKRRFLTSFITLLVAFAERRNIKVKSLILKFIRLPEKVFNICMLKYKKVQYGKKLEIVGIISLHGDGQIHFGDGVRINSAC